EDIREAEDLIERSKVVVTQLEIPIETVKYGLKTAKKKGKYTILDPTPAQVLDCEIIRHVDLIITNKSKLEILSEVPVNNEKDLIRASESLLELGVYEIVIYHEDGCGYINSNEYRKFDFCETYHFNSNNNIFNAALIVKLSQGKSIDKSISYALE